MFATFKTELRAMVADAFDLAIEFATLGEYRLPASDEAPPPVTYPSFEGLPVRGAACSPANGDRARRGGSGRRERRGAGPMTPAGVRLERRRALRPAASARP